MEPPTELLEEVLTKFILTAPDAHLTNFEEMMFLVEHAYWYYEDHVREKMPNLRHYGRYADFAVLLFQKCSFLQPYVGQLGDIIDRFRKYKQSIPVYGAILLDPPLEKVLLVRGYKAASGWGFPRGKINQNETETACAAREVWEETGLDIESRIVESQFLKVVVDGKLHKLFILWGIDPDTTCFAPKVQKEIGAYGWHFVKDLPATIDEANQVYLSSQGHRHRFFMVQPFVKKLCKWITDHKHLIDAKPPLPTTTKAQASQGQPVVSKTGSISVDRNLLVGSASIDSTATSSNAKQGPQQVSKASQYEPPNLCMNKSFRFDRDAIMRSLMTQ